ncbi:hypothetical protein TNCV_543081 [Trichonephila clavipes]|nr:hypothetical protein TNCV_543081 [Trichonephila clavipes]
MVLKANDRRTSCHDEFRGPQSDYVRQVALETTVCLIARFFVDLENPNCLMKCNGPCVAHLRFACDRKRLNLAVLPYIIPKTNSGQPQYVLCMQLPKRPHLRINDAQCYSICIAFAILNSVSPYLLESIARYFSTINADLESKAKHLLGREN